MPDIKPGQEPITVTEGESISVADVESAANAPEEKEEVVEAVAEPKEETKAEPSTEENAPKGKYESRFKEVYAKSKEMERKAAELEAKLAMLEGRQPPANTQMTDAEKQAMQAEFLADPAGFLQKFGKQNRDAVMQEVKSQHEELKRTMEATQADAWLSSVPESKGDPDFNEHIADIIQANPGLVQATKQGLMSPSDMAKMVYAQYSLARAEQTRQQNTEEVKAQRLERGDIAKNAVAAIPSAGKGGKRTWKESEIAQLDEKQYNSLASEIDLAEREGRVLMGQ